MLYLETLIRPINFTWAGINASHNALAVNAENHRYSPKMFLKNRFIVLLSKMIIKKFMETFLSILTFGTWQDAIAPPAIRVDVTVLAILPIAMLKPSGNKKNCSFVHLLRNVS